MHLHAEITVFSHDPGQKGSTPMQDIRVGRFDADPQAQGVIRPQDGRWQLVIDKDGYPEHVSIRDLMDGGEFGDVLPPEDEARAYEAFLADRERNPVPCPRV